MGAPRARGEGQSRPGNDGFGPFRRLVGFTSSANSEYRVRGYDDGVYDGGKGSLLILRGILGCCSSTVMERLRPSLAG